MGVYEIAFGTLYVLLDIRLTQIVSRTRLSSDPRIEGKEETSMGHPIFKSVL